MDTPSSTRSVSSRSRRQYLQFSLRSLLIVMTVVSIWLGLYVDRVRRQQRAVAIIRSHGFTDIRYGRPDSTIESPPSPKWLGNLLGIDYFANVGHVSMFGPRLDDDCLKALADLPALQTLNLRSHNITDDSLFHLSGLRKLRELRLTSRQVSDKGLACLDGLRHLKRLNLDCPMVSGAGLACLEHLSELEQIDMAREPAEEAGLPGSWTKVDCFDPIQVRYYLRVPRQDIEKALDSTTRLDFFDTPFYEVVNYLTMLHGVPIQLDNGLDKETAVTFHRNGVPLRDGLDAMLSPLGLTWRIDRSRLSIVKKDSRAGDAGGGL